MDNINLDSNHENKDKEPRNRDLNMNQVKNELMSLSLDDLKTKLYDIIIEYNTLRIITNELENLEKEYYMSNNTKDDNDDLIDKEDDRVNINNKHLAYFSNLNIEILIDKILSLSLHDDKISLLFTAKEDYSLDNNNLVKNNNVCNTETVDTKDNNDLEHRRNINIKLLNQTELNVKALINKKQKLYNKLNNMIMRNYQNNDSNKNYLKNQKANNQQLNNSSNLSNINNSQKAEVASKSLIDINKDLIIKQEEELLSILNNVLINIRNKVNNYYYEVVEPTKLIINSIIKYTDKIQSASNDIYNISMTNCLSDEVNSKIQKIKQHELFEINSIEKEINDIECSLNNIDNQSAEYIELVKEYRRVTNFIELEKRQ